MVCLNRAARALARDGFVKLEGKHIHMDMDMQSSLCSVPISRQFTLRSVSIYAVHVCIVIWMTDFTADIYSKTKMFSAGSSHEYGVYVGGT